MPFTIKEMCIVFRKSACLFGQVKTKMYLPESPFSKKSLAGASGLVLMSVPVECHQDELESHFFSYKNMHEDNNNTFPLKRVPNINVGVFKYYSVNIMLKELYSVKPS